MNLILSLFSLSISFQWSMLSTLLLPADVLRFVPATEKTFYLSWIAGLVALVAMGSQPFAGAWSDRWTGHWGRRRPLILLGTVVNGLGLAGMAGARNLYEYVTAFLVMDVASNLAIGAYHGLWRDQTTAHHRGALSGWVGFISILGYVTGLWFGGMLAAASSQLAYLVIMIVFPAGAILTIGLVRETPVAVGEPPNQSRGIRGFWSRWHRHPDFVLACLHRLFVLLGFNLVIVYLAYYVKDSLGLADYLRATGSLGTVVMLAAMASSLVAGGFSDRFGRKRPVIGAGIVMGLSVAYMATASTFSTALAAGVVFGLAYGVFMAVDLALALDVLPSQATAARDIAIWHVTYQLARTLAPIVGGTILHLATLFGNEVAGYPALFLLAAAFFWLGSCLVFRITSVR